jgi:hypothetical protein
MAWYLLYTLVGVLLDNLHFHITPLLNRQIDPWGWFLGVDLLFLIYMSGISCFEFLSATESLLDVTSDYE